MRTENSWPIFASEISSRNQVSRLPLGSVSLVPTWPQGEPSKKLGKADPMRRSLYPIILQKRIKSHRILHDHSWMYNK